MKLHSLNPGLAFILGAIALTGCSVLKPKPDLTQFYVLRSQSTTPRAEVQASTALPEIRVGPGRVAGYLETTPIAVQDGANRIQYLDVHHWAEPLSKGLSRTLGENLARKLNVAHIILYPDPSLDASGYEVRYTVDRFEGTLAGPVTLQVSWEVVQRPSAKVIASARSLYVIPGADQAKDVTAYVDRLALSVEQWSDEIAAAIRSGAAAKP
jgi:uncharacterized lipoprotein YmbA